MSKSVWLLNLPQWLTEAGLKVELWPNWETRSRNSGGYTGSVKGVVVHHTASNTKPQNDCAYNFDNAEYRPVGAVLLDRDGIVWIGASGATNCAGKGAWPRPGHKNSKGEYIPVDQGNAHTFSIEGANNGSQPWPAVQQRSYVTLCAVLCIKLNLQPIDVVSHFEWTPRKIDPAGKSEWSPGGGQWNMDAFRASVAERIVELSAPKPPPYTPYPPRADAQFGNEFTMKMLKSPVRIFDTRHEKSGSVKAGKTVTVNVPKDVQSESMFVTVTAINPSGKGYVTVWDGVGAQPTASALNFMPGVNVANTTGVAVAGGKSFKLFASAETGIAIDVVSIG